MLLPSQQTSWLEIRSGPFYLKFEKSKKVQRFSITPSLMPVRDLPQVRLVLLSQGLSAESTRKQTEMGLLPCPPLPRLLPNTETRQALPDILLTASVRAERPLAQRLPWQVFTRHRDNSA